MTAAAENIKDRCDRCDSGAPEREAIAALIEFQRGCVLDVDGRIGWTVGETLELLVDLAAKVRAGAYPRSEPASGAPDSSALLAELRAQVEEARRERDEARAWERAARETARLLGSVLGRYSTQRRCRLAALLWRSARSRRLRERLHDAEVAAEQGVLVARDLEERLRAERAAGMELRASLVEAATFARGVVGKCDCLTCAPSQQLAERWERQARGTEASRG